MITTTKHSAMSMQATRGTAISLRIQHGIWRYRAAHKCLPYAVILHPKDLRALVNAVGASQLVPANVHVRCTPLWGEPALVSEGGVVFEL
jgi:hypothetical protein